MSGAVLPPVIPEPFAKNADPSLIQNPIPQTTGAQGRASYDQGFPAITMQPVAAGGKPPFGQDFNGLFFALTSQQYFAQAGQLWPYNAAVAAAIGGYGVGSVLVSSDGQTVWLNTADANSTDPDGGSAAGWVSLFTYGYLSLTGQTGGTVTLNMAQARRSTIIISGSLAANLAVILPPQLRQWLIVNNTTGAFNVTVRTASGTGVTIPQGGFGNPVGVYGDGTNIYPTVPASSLIPADQNATANTLAQRTNAGYLLATYFNQNSSIENPPVGAVFVQNTSGDGYLRKASLAYFESVMALQSIGGQVQPSQIVAAAVTQFTSLILASAALTGTPTAPTAAVGTSNSQVATTAFANPAQSKATTGFVELPGGVFFQWGTVGPVSDPGNNGVDAGISFPTAFPSACVMGICTSNRSIAGNGQAASGTGFTTNRTRFGMTCTIDSVGGGVASGVWFAIGF